MTTHGFERLCLQHATKDRMHKSKENGSDPSSVFSKEELLISGQWYLLRINSMDHWNIIGHLVNKDRESRSKNFFLSHIEILKNLPKN